MSTVPTYVLDASVAVKWYLPESDSDRAARLLTAAEDGLVSLIAPELLLLEVANAVWKHERRGELSQEDALGALVRLKETSLAWVPDQDWAYAALGLSLALGCAVYDATYLAVAEAYSAQVLTDDRRLCALCTEAGLTDRAILLSELDI